ncbi:Hyaluronan synthase [Pseudonocardia sp. Ae406_Ps2]|nr:Hyaluronan synthase [Pseudonocardia sp. Ae406_Ps2]OLM07323.1 Hyaluronan synthase [Pseudonocardia sp. Ae331_Ps2]OLM22464.1 Hyaluronan synthase [Pseudonocardia sp. Ae706_Ps2]
MLCVCGSLAFWRADIVKQRTDEFLGQQFLGETCSYGDDRHLTNLSLLHGRVVIAHRAVARTAVPEKGGHLIRQQVRWGRSFFRESLFALTNLRPKRAAWWLTLLETVSWVGFTAGLVLALFILPAMTGEAHWIDYLVWVVLAGYARSVHMFSVRRAGRPWWVQTGVFLMAPLYGMIHVLALLPLRLWSLATLRSTSWGTRAKGVGVAAATSWRGHACPA